MRKYLTMNKKMPFLLFGLVILYIAFICVDLLLPEYTLLSSALKYLSLILCFLLCLNSWKNSVSVWDYILLLLVFAITLVADIFLLFINHWVLGIVVFCCAHLVALLRYSVRAFRVAMFIVPIVFIACIIASFFTQSASVFLALVLLYAGLIITVTISAFRSKLPRLSRIFAQVGMVLFILCDINVLLFNILPAGAGLFSFSRVAMWVFYLPAQTLIALSSYYYEGIQKQLPHKGQPAH